jgi:hypothetical protein
MGINRIVTTDGRVDGSSPSKGIGRHRPIAPGFELFLQITRFESHSTARPFSRKTTK